MSTLHTVNKSPFSTQSLVSCLGHAKDGDTVLLIEDGVYGAISQSGISDTISARATEVNLCVLQPDLEARGVDAAKVVEGVNLVDYSGFVELAAKHSLTQAWL